MMSKYQVFLFVVAYFNLVCADSRPKVIFAPEVLQILRTSVVKCIDVTGIDPDVIHLIEEGQYRTDEVFEKFIHCVYSTAGFSNSDGSVKVKEAASLLPKEYSDVEDVLINCNQIIKDDPVKTTYNLFKCFQDNSPVIMAICYENGDKNINVCK